MTTQEIKKQSVEEMLAGTKAGKIWEDLKDRDIEMFGLPGQKVHQYVKPEMIDTEKLFLTMKVSAVLPALENSAAQSDERRGKMAYSVELADKFAIITPTKK